MSIQKRDHAGLIDLILAACIPIWKKSYELDIFLNPDQIQFILVRVHFNIVFRVYLTKRIDSHQFWNKFFLNSFFQLLLGRKPTREYVICDVKYLWSKSYSHYYHLKRNEWWRKLFEKMLPNVLGIINDKFYTTNKKEKLRYTQSRFDFRLVQ